MKSLLKERDITNHVKTPSATTALLKWHAFPHFPAEFQLATAANAESHSIVNMTSTEARANGFANFLVRGNLCVIVRYMIAGTVKKHCATCKYRE
jgi:hypothetical protein